MSECREKDPEIIFIGDCIFETLQHTETWNSYFAPLHCLNFSIYQDQTQNVLWRLKNGELDNVKPKIVVLLVGTNNVHNTADEVAEGILEIVKTIRDKLADSYIVLPVINSTIRRHPTEIVFIDFCPNRFTDSTTSRPPAKHMS